MSKLSERLANSWHKTTKEVLALRQQCAEKDAEIEKWKTAAESCAEAMNMFKQDSDKLQIALGLFHQWACHRVTCCSEFNSAKGCDCGFADALKSAYELGNQTESESDTQKLRIAREALKDICVTAVQSNPDAIYECPNIAQKALEQIGEMSDENKADLHAPEPLGWDCPQCAEKDAEISKINGWREELRLKLRRVQNDYSVMESERNEAFKCLRIAREALNEIKEESRGRIYGSFNYNVAQKALEQIGEMSDENKADLHTPKPLGWDCPKCAQKDAEIEILNRAVMDWKKSYTEIKNSLRIAREALRDLRRRIPRTWEEWPIVAKALEQIGEKE